MSRPRDRASSNGLLPLMEARPWKDGKTVTYRYHPIGGAPIKLGTDKVKAIRAVLDMNGDNSDRGTVAELWRLYQESPEWVALSEASRVDYTQSSKPLLKIFAKMAPGSIKPTHCNRYLRVERIKAPIRANRELALLSNLMNLAVNRGDIDANPCKQVRRNKEQPRHEVPETVDLSSFLAWAQARGGQSMVLAGMAEYAAIAGNRRIEFRPLHWPQVDDEIVRLKRGKQRGHIVIEAVNISERLAALFERMRGLAKDPRVGPVFPNRDGNPHTERGFKSAWARLMAAAIKAGVLQKRIKFHDLRAYYTTHYKLQHGQLPDLHANPATTARVYDRSKEVKRRSL
jgi:integrase